MYRSTVKQHEFLSTPSKYFLIVFLALWTFSPRLSAQLLPFWSDHAEFRSETAVLSCESDSLLKSCQIGEDVRSERGAAMRPNLWKLTMNRTPWVNLSHFSSKIPSTTEARGRMQRGRPVKVVMSSRRSLGPTKGRLEGGRLRLAKADPSISTKSGRWRKTGCRMTQELPAQVLKSPNASLTSCLVHGARACISSTSVKILKIPSEDPLWSANMAYPTPIRSYSSVFPKMLS